MTKLINQRNLLLLGTLFFCIHVQAQQVQDVVHLKNGGVFKGEILRQDSTGLLIKTYGDNIIRVEYKDLSHSEKDTVVIENPSVQRTETRVAEPVKEEVPFEEAVAMRKGVAGDIMFGFGIGTNITAHLKFNLGYNISPHFYLGGSFGLDGYSGAMLTPALIQRLYIGPSASVFHPYLWAEEAFLVHSSLSYGDRPALGSEFKVGLGTRFNLGPHFGLGMQLGYGYLTLKEKYEVSDPWGWPMQGTQTHLISHSVGRFSYSIALFF